MSLPRDRLRRHSTTVVHVPSENGRPIALDN